MIEGRWRSPATEDSLDDLVRAAPEAVMSWMRRKALLADGTQPGLPVLDPQTVEQAIRVVADQENDTWRIGRRKGWLVLQVGLTRQMCGLGLNDVGDRAGLAQSATSQAARLHYRLLVEDAEYAERAGAVVSLAMGVWRVKSEEE